MAPWKKIQHSGKGKSPPHWLEVSEGKYVRSYRVNYRRDGVDLRKVLEGEFSEWKDAAKVGEELIYKARFGESKAERAFLRNEEIARQLIEESAGQDQATIDGKKRIFEKHLIPWLNDYYPYAKDLTVRTWPEYKLFKRRDDPTIALENHVKYFRMLARRAFDLGIVKPRIEIKFNVKKEEFREEGLVIPDEDLAKMLVAANFRKSRNADGTPSHGQGHRVWYCRIVIQRDTGMRPGEVRNLRKAQVLQPKTKKPLPPNVEFQFKEGDTARPATAKVRLFEEDTKTHRYREFMVRSARAVDALWDRFNRNPDSPYLFPMETDPGRPMDKHLGGWRAVLKRAGVSPDYTPHDLRHTYATEMFQRTKNYASLCYQLDMSLETAMKVYLHLDAKDTQEIADLVASETEPRTEALVRKITEENSHA